MGTKELFLSFLIIWILLSDMSSLLFAVYCSIFSISSQNYLFPLKNFQPFPHTINKKIQKFFSRERSKRIDKQIGVLG